MKLTAEFDDHYGGRSHVRIESIDVVRPTPSEIYEGLDDWSYENLFPHTGDGNATAEDAGYFVTIRVCAEQPELVGKTFEFGL